jgi:predicted O-methyltransferase YrrM
MAGIIFEDVESYLRGLIPNSNPYLAQMEDYAREYNVPIIQKEGARLLNLLVKLHQPQRILEIGTAIGYSTAWLAEALNESGQVVTIEIDEERAKVAEANLKALNYNHNVEIKVGDARDIIPTLEESFDFVFLDAAKGQYLNYFQSTLPLLKPGGIIVADNVLFRGMVAGVEVPKRYKTLVKGLRQFLADLYENPQFDTTLLPIGDGISISRKKL